MLNRWLRCLINKSQKFAQLYREHCTFHKNLYFVKDLSKLGRDLKDVVIVDNSPSAYMFHPQNAIPISSWYHDASDRELYKTITFLTKLANVDDVRDYWSKPKLSAFSSVPGSPQKKEVLLSDDKRLKISASSNILIKKKHKSIFKTTKSSACDSLTDQKLYEGDSQDNSPPQGATTIDDMVERLNTSRRKYRSPVKRTQVNQFFNNEQKVWFFTFKNFSCFKNYHSAMSLSKRQLAKFGLKNELQQAHEKRLRQKIFKSGAKVIFYQRYKHQSIRS